MDCFGGRRDRVFTLVQKYVREQVLTFGIADGMYKEQGTARMYGIVMQVGKSI